MIDEQQRRRHAQRSLRLAITALAMIGFLVLAVPLVAPLLSGYSFLRFPLGLFLMVHGAVLGVIAVIYWASARQDHLDRSHGLTSEL